MQKMRFGVQALVFGMVTAFSSGIDACCPPPAHPAAAAGVQVIKAAKVIYVDQLIQTVEALGTVPTQLLQLGYDGKKKAQILAALEKGCKNIRKIFGDAASGRMSTQVPQPQDPSVIMKNAHHMISMAHKMGESQDAVRNAIVMFQNMARIIVAHGEFNQKSAVSSVMTAKYIVEVINGLYKWTAFAPEEISSFYRVLREMHREVPMINESYRWSELLAEDLGLAHEDMYGLYGKLIEIYSRGFVKLVAGYANRGAFDVNREDDSGETLLAWAERVDLPLVAEGLKGLGAE